MKKDIKSIIKGLIQAIVCVFTISVILGAIDGLINPRTFLQDWFTHIAIPVTICFCVMKYGLSRYGRLKDPTI